MTDIDPSSWFLVLYSVSILGIAVFLIRAYSNKYFDLKAKVHALHVCIELIDSSLEDESISKAEFIAIVKRCLTTIGQLIP